MYKAYKFRLYSIDAQKVLINKTFCCYRFYNYFLDKCKKNSCIKAFDPQQELVKAVWERNKISKKESDSITAMSREHSYFTNVTKVEKVLTDSREHSCIVGAGLTIEESQNRLNTGLEKVKGKTIGFKKMIKKIFRKFHNQLLV